ncbi:MAG: LLM class flavin-dependent oxidoreductase [bacterium]|nr:LLM class flavin-dependent oxidoreductase [bacterium]
MQVDFAALAVPDSLTPEGLHVYQQHVRREEWGYHSLVMPDTQSIWRELYVTMTVIGMSTQRVKIWPAVTNPLTRHPAVAASAIASLHELTGGRAVFNIGSGDSAVYNLGLKGAKLATTREYLVAIKELFAKQETVYRGKIIRLLWPSRPVPVYVTAEGPKTLEMAGELAELGVSKMLMAFFSHSAAAVKDHRFATEVMPHFRA